MLIWTSFKSQVVNLKPSEGNIQWFLKVLGIYLQSFQNYEHNLIFRIFPKIVGPILLPIPSTVAMMIPFSHSFLFPFNFQPLDMCGKLTGGNFVHWSYMKIEGVIVCIGGTPPPPPPHPSIKPTQLVVMC